MQMCRLTCRRFGEVWESVGLGCRVVVSRPGAAEEPESCCSHSPMESRGSVSIGGVVSESEGAGVLAVREEGAGKYSLRQQERQWGAGVSRALFGKERGGEESTSLETMILTLSEEIKKGFAVSEVNQRNSRQAYEMLEKKFDLLPLRTQALEESVGAMKEELRKNYQEIWQLKDSEQEMQDKLKRLENSSRRNNLRSLNVPDGVEEDYLKAYVTSLIMSILQIEEGEYDFAIDIQRIHRDPFRSDLSKKNPRKMLVNFQLYALKKILLKA
ncbi:hypothetical protein NDU88_002278 [Pleurodeles waltl]|uniref:Uncharacterized protein n=1 Tax=Pleurodeles waltl TaxID=8319 RepID=A0AAV7VYW7_PLEWA|nr:hypothetical protein NDU88_002278 [Pleurodeles waltl]